MSDNESGVSFPELLTGEQMTDFDSNDMMNRQNNTATERNVIDQRFHEMNRQIGESTDLVLALTQQISSNHREGNELNALTTGTNSRSDMVTGVQNPHPSGSRTTSPNRTPRSDISASQLTDVTT